MRSHLRRALFIASLATPYAASPAVAQFRTPHGSPIDGVACDAMEGQRIHIHQHLLILDRGQPVPIPYDVGRPAGAQCLYWLHTHTPDGIIHVESPRDRSFTLATFFAIWDQPLSRSRAATAKVGKGERMKIWVNGALYRGDPRAIKLGDHTDIVIEVGPPFSTPKPFTAWNGAQ